MSRRSFSNLSERAAFDGSEFLSTSNNHQWLARAVFERQSGKSYNAFRKVTPAQRKAEDEEDPQGRDFPCFDRCMSDATHFLAVSCKFEREAHRTPRGCVLTTGTDSHRRGVQAALDAGVPYPVVYGHFDPAGQARKGRAPNTWRVFVFNLADHWTGEFAPAYNRDGSPNPAKPALAYTMKGQPSGDGAMVYPPRHPRVGEATDEPTIFYKALRVYTTRMDIEWAEFAADPDGPMVPTAMRDHILGELINMPLCERK